MKSSYVCHETSVVVGLLKRVDDRLVTFFHNQYVSLSQEIAKGADILVLYLQGGPKNGATDS